MTDDHIKITLSAMESCSKSFSDCSTTIVEIAQSLGAASAAMKTAWDDPAQITFEESMDEMVKEFDKVHSCLKAMSAFSSYTVDLYKTVDKILKGLL